MSLSWSWSRRSRACDPGRRTTLRWSVRARWTAWCWPRALPDGILLTPISAEAVAALLAQDPLPPEAEVAHPGRFAGERPRPGGGTDHRGSGAVTIELNGRSVELLPGATVADAVSRGGS